MAEVKDRDSPVPAILRPRLFLYSPRERAPTSHQTGTAALHEPLDFMGCGGTSDERSLLGTELSSGFFLVGRLCTRGLVPKD